ncbi:MAG: hypothetical protein DRJ44_07065 [Thermoprotei archaeon]|nr:MAG: hypothetical protein DRJ44_07065 [Thermoprotei archaeon]
MSSLKPFKCPVCGAPLTPSQGQKFVKCDYCGSIIDVSTEKKREITWYYQPLGSENVQDKGVISLREALTLLEKLKISPQNPPNGIPEIIGFRDETGAFIEFTRYSQFLYDVRYEDVKNNEFLVGYDVPLFKAQQMLIDFLEGRELKWKNLLKPE